MCSADGGHPDTPCFDQRPQLLHLGKVAYAAPRPEQVHPAWRFYIDRAYAAIKAIEMYETTAAEVTEKQLTELANCDYWTTDPGQPTQVDIEMQAL